LSRVGVAAAAVLVSLADTVSASEKAPSARRAADAFASRVRASAISVLSTARATSSTMSLGGDTAMSGNPGPFSSVSSWTKKLAAGLPDREGRRRLFRGRRPRQDLQDLLLRTGALLLAERLPVVAAHDVGACFL